MACRPPFRRQGTAGFSLIELITAIAILLVLMAIIFQIISVLADNWKRTSGQIKTYQGSRATFDALARTLSQATLRPYWDYVDSQSPPQPRNSSNQSTFVPAQYARASELQFICGPAYNSSGNSLLSWASNSNTSGDAIFFQAPLGVVNATSSLGKLNKLLNSVGFFVEFSDDSSIWPSFIQNLIQKKRYRYRLMQWAQPAEYFNVYQCTANALSGSGTPLSWFGSNYLPAPGESASGKQTQARMLAENVIVLFILPKLSPNDEDYLDDGTINSSQTGGRLAPNYCYDSRSWVKNYNGAVSTTAIFGHSGPSLITLMRNQLPPLLDVAMITIDSKDADRLALKYGSQPPPELAIPSNTFHLRGGSNASDYFDNDLKTYEQQLVDARISYRIFRSTIQIEGAKWSSSK